MSGYGPDVTVSIPEELNLDYDNSDWRRHRYRRSPRTAPSAGPAFPELIPAGETSFACSGSIDSQRYREATKYRTLPEMVWEEARIALARLCAPVRYEHGGGGSREYVALAEFALAAAGFTGFVGKRGEHAVKLRDELTHAVGLLHRRLDTQLARAARVEHELARPLPLFAEDMADDAGVRRLSSTAASVLGTWLPAAGGQWVGLHKASPEQAMRALDSLRGNLAVWRQRQAEALAIAERLLGDDLPSASEYAEAVHIADMLVWAGETLLAAYAGYMIAMPIYRLYPSTPESEAIALWWPWGHPPPLVDGRPPRPPKPGRRVFDPSIITATRPQDVVREVMQKTGINRTTVQRMTASIRAEMRSKRQYQARMLLLDGLTKAEVARRVSLSPSRISALFKGERFADLGRRRELLHELQELL